MRATSVARIGEQRSNNGSAIDLLFILHDPKCPVEFQVRV